eukprot:282053-Amorphochlora_amoeboformis.AAC.1
MGLKSKSKTTHFQVKFYFKTIRRMYQSALGSTFAATMSSGMARKPPLANPEIKDVRILSRVVPC